MKYFLIFTSFICFFLNSTAQLNYRDAIDVQHYNITLDISNFGSYTLHGHTQIIFKTTGETINQIAFDLFKYTVDSAIFNGLKIAEFSYNDTIFSYTPETPILPEQTDTCTIYYHGFATLEPNSGWGGVHFGNNMVFNMGVAINDVPHGFGRAWFPCIDNFTDRATYNINLITKNTHKGIATGTLQEVIDYSTTKKMWKWEFNQTSPTYLVSFAIGNFTLNSINVEGMNNNFPLEIYALNSDSSAAATTFVDVPEMITNFESLFGPYHWPKAGYTVVEFNSGAMEHLTNIAYPSYALSTDISSQTLAAHELSHHWFGNQITCANAGEMWINEGWASYCEALYMEHFHGKEAYNSYVKDNQYKVVNTAHNIDGAYWALSGIPTNLTYSTTVYDKGSMIVHNLRHYMGDEKFFPAVKDMLVTFSESHINSSQMRDHLSAHSGIDLTGFFNNYVFNGGFPQYVIQSVAENNNGYKVRIAQQSVGRNFYGNNNKVEVTFYDNDWQEHNRWVEFDGSLGAGTFPLDFEPKMTILDAHNYIAGPVKDDLKIINSTNSYSPNGILVTVTPQEITDSVLIHIAQMYKGPKETGQIINEIEPLNIPWWSVTYDAKGTFEANGKFTYNTSSLEDTTLNNTDTLILVYRQNNDLNWEIITADWLGTITAGSFITTNLQNGFYAIARYKKGLKATSPIKQNNLKVWPNPSNTGYNIQIPTGNISVLSVFDAQGRLVDKVKLTNTERNYYYPAQKLKNGQYTLQVESKNLLSSCKVMKIK